jgi:hypothetical protein
MRKKERGKKLGKIYSYGGGFERIKFRDNIQSFE